MVNNFELEKNSTGKEKEEKQLNWKREDTDCYSHRSTQIEKRKCFPVYFRSNW
jgi:hypothetical protein